MINHQAHNSLVNFHFNRKIFTDILFPPHFHKSFELLYVVSGNTPVRIGSIQYELTQGDLLLLPPYAIHTFSISESSQVWVGTFSADYIQAFAKKHEDTLYTPFRCDPDIEALLKERLFQNHMPDRYMAKGCLYLVCDQCRRYAQEATRVDFNRILQITQMVDDHLTENITMDQVAQELNYEYHYLSRLFHQLFGMNFRDFVNLHRVERACQLLTETETDIAQVALECGFQTVRSFNRVFRSIMLQTPSQYRTQAQKPKAEL